MTLLASAAGGWPLDNVPPAELIGMARTRDEYGHELFAKGLYEDAQRQWKQAEAYRERAEGRWS